jgi:hypothetical protein
VPAILEKALLDAESDFSHHRAVALALERLGDSSAARRTGPTAGQARDDGARARYAGRRPRTHADDSAICTPSRTRNESIRELLLARALFRLGDHEGIGASILAAYANDLRGHLARHAGERRHFL